MVKLLTQLALVVIGCLEPKDSSVCIWVAPNIDIIQDIIGMVQFSTDFLKQLCLWP